MHDLMDMPTNTVATEYLSELTEVLALVPGDALARVAQLLLDVRAAGRRVYIVGNGGSAATASHFVCDLVKTARVPGLEPLRAFALTDNIPLLTAWSNDSAYEDCFAEQVAALAEPGDLVIGISASGNSPNVVSALRTAANRDIQTIGILGFDGGAAARSSTWRSTCPATTTAWSKTPTWPSPTRSRPPYARPCNPAPSWERPSSQAW